MTQQSDSSSLRPFGCNNNHCNVNLCLDYIDDSVEVMRSSMVYESTEQISHIHLLLGLLHRLGSFLLLRLLFFGGRGVLLCGRGRRSSNGSGSASSNAFLSVSNQLMERLSLEGCDHSVDVVIRSLRSDGSEERLDIVGAWIEQKVPISVLPERASRA